MTSPFAPALHPRLTPARGDLAAASLRGQVEADRFVQGERFTVCVEVADMRRRPRPDAPLDTQLLYGETLTVYDEEEGWGWAQADRDDYVGYVAMSVLTRGASPATHRVVAARTFVYPAADMKQPPFAAVPLNGRFRVEGRRGDFLEIGGHGFVFAAHAEPLGAAEHDFVAVAERLIGVPYLWGGASPLGIDCSGLVQLSCAMAGRALPRDTDMQEDVGQPLPCGDALPQVRRGDLVFWKGHVGILCDSSTLLHANAYHMMVAREPFDTACARIRESGSQISSIRRLT